MKIEFTNENEKIELTLEEFKRKIIDIISEKEEYKKSYFWKPSTIAALRRSKEFVHDWEFTIDDKDHYKIHSSYKESCNNCYYSMSINLNEKYKDIRAITKLLKQVNKELLEVKKKEYNTYTNLNITEINNLIKQLKNGKEVKILKSIDYITIIMKKENNFELNLLNTTYVFNEYYKTINIDELIKMLQKL